MLKYLSKFAFLLGPRKRRLVFLMVAFLFLSLLETVGIGLVGPFIALASNPEFLQRQPKLAWICNQLGLSRANSLVFFGLVLIVLFYIKAYLGFTVQRQIFDFGFRVQGDLCSRLMRAYLRAPYTFHLGINSSLLLQNITDDTARFSTRVITPLLFAVSNLVIIAALGLLLLTTDPLATVTISGVLLTCFWLFHQFRHRIAHWGKEASQAGEEIMRIVNHGLGGLKETRTIGCEPYFEQQLQAQTQRYALAEADYLGFSNLPRYLMEAFLITFLIGFAFIFIISGRNNSQDLSAVLGVFAMASIRLLPAAGNLVASVNGIRHASYSVNKLYYDLKNLETEEIKATDPALAKLSLMPFEQEIELDRVVYTYPGATEPSLKGISLRLRKGESIGLIGRSGAGKTTLVDVILGLLTPESGDIRADGLSIYRNLRSWQNLVGYIPQTIFLLDDSLARNIAYGVPDHQIDPERLEQAIEAAQLKELVDDLPEGIHTRLGERGVRLSGGQRQRIGIARVLYHDREVLVLDEATAALDNETEGLITEAIRLLGGRKTLVIIAHRLSTVQHCDRLYRLEKGQVVKVGSYREVVLDEAVF